MKMPSLKKTAMPLLLAVPFVLCVTSVQAAWQLVSERSQLGYTTTKVFPGAEKSAAENNRFARLEGEVADDGSASVRVVLDSVNTNVAIRDERMRKIVFRTDEFPVAAVSAKVPRSVLEEKGLHQIDLTMQIQIPRMRSPVKTQSIVVEQWIKGSDGVWAFLPKENEPGRDK